MAILENLAQGFAQAANAPEAAAGIQKVKDDRRATAHEELQANTNEVLDEVRELHKQKADPNTDPKSIPAIDKRLDELQQHFVDLYHPAKNPGALQHLGGFLKAHSARQQADAALDAGPRNIPATPGEAKQRFSMSGGPVVAQKQAPNPEAQYIKDLEGAGFSHDDAVKASRIRAKLDAPAAAAKTKRALREGTVNGQIVSIYQDPNDPADAIYPSGEPVPPEILGQFQPLPPRGFIASKSKTTDPFGVVSETDREPVIPGGNKSNPVSAPTRTPVVPGQGGDRQIPRTPGEARHRAAAVAPKGSQQLDEQGHIPATARVNPQLREAANNLIDGMDVDKLPIPQRDRAAAEQLAKQYGWSGQGLFGPKDKLLIRESTGILKQLGDSPSLSVLDDTGSRLKIQQVLQNPDKRSVIGQTIQGLTAQNLTEPEQEFVTLYNQAVGRISGLSQLVRSGRATEAQIERLKQELPNPATTASSKDAKRKLAQIQNEIDIALEKGQFVDQGGGAAETKTYQGHTYEKQPDGSWKLKQ